MARRLVLLAMAALVVSCGMGARAGERTVVTARLEDHSIELSQDTISDGAVTFHVGNEGTMIHELEVFAADNADMPVVNSVADTTGLRLIDEVEDIPPGTTRRLDLDPEPGHYVIICNLPGHYQAGMVTELEVTG